MNAFKPIGELSLVERPWKGVSFLTLAEAGVEMTPDGIVRIPFRWPSGLLCRWRYFAPDGKTWWEPGTIVVPMGLETIPSITMRTTAALLLAEGESDALALREAYADVRADCPIRRFTVIGIPGARMWRASWARLASGFGRVYALGDGDASGRDFNDMIIRYIPEARLVRLPDGRDARSVLQHDGAQTLDALLDQADRRAALWRLMRNASSLDDLVDALEQTRVGMVDSDG